MRQKIFLYLNLSIISFFLLTGIVFAVWNGPTEDPPGDNVPIPLNVSDEPQSKANGLVLNTGGFAVGLVVQSGAVTLPNDTIDTNEVNFNYAGSASKGGAATNIAGGAAGSVPFQAAAGSTTMLAAGANGKVLKMISGVPGWGDDIDTDTNTDEQQLGVGTGVNANKITLTNGGAVTAPAANNLMAGAAGQIPYQTAANTTAFDSTFTWESNGVYPSHKKLTISQGKLAVIDNAGSIYTPNDVIYAETNVGIAIRAVASSGNAIFATTASGSYAIAAQRSTSPSNRVELATPSYAIDASGTIRASNFCGSIGDCVNQWTSASSSNAGVKRDANGDFSAHDITARKITADIYDPVYTINGVNYATYLPSMTGVKEETTGVLALSDEENGIYKYIIDFDDAVIGSDLWLFSKVTNLKNTLESLVVILSPAFDGRVWYEKDILNNKLSVYGASAGEVSYRLTAPRFDSAEWTNYNNDIGAMGLIIK